MVNIGELNQRIQIIKLIPSEDEDGYPKMAEAVMRTAWAKVSRASGTEQLKAGTEVLRERLRFLVRWSRVPISRKMIIRYRGADYQIDFINDYEDRHQFVEIWCERVTQEG